jgi:eukaryotic-like serine/threonine-protein kinase
VLTPPHAWCEAQFAFKPLPRHAASYERAGRVAWPPATRHTSCKRKLGADLFAPTTKAGAAVEHAGDPLRAAGLAEGQVLAGKYRVERVLGVGGVGIVVAARHLLLDQIVAIKFLLPAMASNVEAVARFEREARSAARIKGEHVARIFDVGETEGGAPFMVMELLEGGDLAQWLAQRGPLPIAHAVDFVLQACVAIAAAHSLGIVHRDLKPANLFCVPRSDGQLLVKVLDFGISKVVEYGASGSAVSVTRTSSVLGSPHYMSPEQAQGAKDVDTRTDIWALGVILHELLAGSVPFPGDAFGAIAVKISTHPAPALDGLRSDAPPELAEVVQKCLSKDRRDRFPNVAALARALAPFAPERALGLVDRIAGVRAARTSEADGAIGLTPTPLPTSQTIAPFGRTELASLGIGRRAPLVALWLLLLAALGFAVSLLIVARNRSAPTVVATPAVVASAPPPTESAVLVTLAPVKTTEPPARRVELHAPGGRERAKAGSRDAPDAQATDLNAAAALAELRATIPTIPSVAPSLPLLPPSHTSGTPIGPPPLGPLPPDDAPSATEAPTPEEQAPATSSF